MTAEAPGAEDAFDALGNPVGYDYSGKAARKASLLIEGVDVLELQHDVKRFFEPGRIDALDQLETVRRLWALMGRVLPGLGDDQMAAFEEQAGRNAGHRLVAAPVLRKMEARRDLTFRLRRLPAPLDSGRGTIEDVLRDSPLLRPPWGAGGGTARAYEHLLRLPEAQAPAVGGGWFRLGFWTAEDRLAGRYEFMQDLVRNNKAVSEDAAAVWTFPLVRLDGLPHGTIEGSSRTQRLITPETVIGMHAMRLLAESSRPEELDVVNEIVYGSLEAKPQSFRDPIKWFVQMKRMPSAVGISMELVTEAGWAKSVDREVINALAE